MTQAAFPTAEADAWIAAHRPQALSFLKLMLSVPSVKGDPAPGAPFGPGPRQALQAFLTRAQADGFRVKDLDGYAGHVAWGPSSGPYLAILAHLDVVPEGPGWTHPPFGAVEEGSRLYGRGATDDKGPAVAAYLALCLLRDLGLTPPRPVRLVLGCDEESGFSCLKHYFAHEPAPALAFTPDADFPIVVAEKGILTVRLRLAVPEGNSGAPRLHALAAGTRPNVVAGSGTAHLEVDPAQVTAVAAQLATPRLPVGTRLEVQPADQPHGLRLMAEGRSAHAMDPARGANAATALLVALSAVEELPGRNAIAFLARAAADVTGEALGIASSDAVSGALTANLGLLRWVDRTLEAVFNIRYPVTQRGDALVDRLRQAVAAHPVVVEREGDQAPLYVSADTPLVRTLAEVYRQEVGQPAEFLAIGGGTYARAVPLGVAFGARFPGRPELAHAPDEYLELEDFWRWIRIYARATWELSRLPDPQPLAT